jgi:beta-mannanase
MAVDGARAAMLAIMLVLLGAGSVVAAPLISSGKAALALSPTSGIPGSTVTVTGTSFPAAATGTLTAGTTRSTFTTSTDGRFTADWTVDGTPGSTVTVRASVGKKSAQTTFAVTSPTIAPRVAGGSPLRLGLMTPGNPTATGELDAATAALGEEPSILLWYEDFAQAPPIAALDAAAARGATPMVTWEPWLWGRGIDQPRYASDRITAGDHDAQITAWGRALAAWGRPVLLRYGHEMNGPWYPWTDGVNGNGSGDFVAAWRHVHDVVARTGASNVQWVWSPNVPDAGMPELSTLYPGSDYVDVVALDGYNWGTATSWSSWTSPSTLFGQPLQKLRAVAPGKPILIAETASAEAGGDKAAWIRRLIPYLSAQSDIEAVVWFNADKEVDWRFDSSPTSAAAMREALAARRTTTQ